MMDFAWANHCFLLGDLILISTPSQLGPLPESYPLLQKNRLETREMLGELSA